MSRGAGSGNSESLTPIPIPIAQRLSAIIPAYRALQLVLKRVSFDDYKSGLHSRDATKLMDVVYPLERALEVVNNYVIELVALGLEELGSTPVDGPRDLRTFAAEGLMTERLTEQLIDIHRARNDLAHEYPDLRASMIYPACQELVKVLPAFLRAYSRWLRSIGYAAPNL